MAQGAKYEPKAVPLSGAIIAVIIAMLAGFIVGKVFAGPARRSAATGGSGDRGDREPIAAKVAPEKFAKIANEGNPPSQGPQDAQVTVVLFSDFMCGFCARIAPAFVDLANRYRGKVRIVYRAFPLDMHPGADLSAEAALAANAQGKFWEYHDILLDNMKAQSRQHLERYAQQLGLDMAAFRSALDQRTYRQAVRASVDLGKSIGVTGTPAVVINGQLISGPHPGKLAEFVQRALEGKSITERSLDAQPAREGAARPSRPPPPLPDEVKDVKVEAWNPSVGPAAAPVKIVLFCEYMCPFCKRIQPTLKQLREAFGDKVQVVYRNLIIHGEPAEVPALAALAAARQGPDKFRALSDLMYEHQGELRNGGRQRIEQLAQDAGLDVARFRADMDSPEVRAQLDADKAEGARVGARGTPSSFINGRFMSGAVPPSHFGAWIDKLLGNATTTIPASADPATAPQRGGCGG